MNKKLPLNPCLPPYEYIADPEPRVFGERLYIFGSHDRFGGKWYCENDYVVWSAPINDLSSFRFDGVIYKKTDDKTDGNLFAPDVVRGNDGRYYLYYSKDDSSKIGVAVSDIPSGKYEFLGYVRYPDGRVLGGSEDEYFMFDPSVLVDGNRIFLYSGSSVRATTTGISRNMAGCTVTELLPDMMTVKTEPKIVLPGGDDWDADIFFEAPSARHIGRYYYLIYAVRNCSGLHYAMSEMPDGGFIHKGTVLSVSGIGEGGHSISSPAYPVGNEHGGLVNIGEDWYIFDHRHTNNCQNCRQTVAEKISIGDDGSLSRAQYTSAGLSGHPLPDSGYYPACCACILTGSAYITMTGKDGDTDSVSYINAKGKAVSGFRYFNFTGGKYKITISLSGSGTMELSLTENGKSIASGKSDTTAEKLVLTADIPECVSGICLRSDGELMLYGFEIEKE